jgi:hypothetical protein
MTVSVFWKSVRAQLLADADAVIAKKIYHMLHKTFNAAEHYKK